MRVLAILVSYSVSLGLSPVHVIKLLYDFLLLISLMSIYFLDQPEEPKRVEENFFLPSRAPPS